MKISAINSLNSDPITILSFRRCILSSNWEWIILSTDKQYLFRFIQRYCTLQCSRKHSWWFRQSVLWWTGEIHKVATFVSHSRCEFLPVSARRSLVSLGESFSRDQQSNNQNQISIHIYNPICELKNNLSRFVNFSGFLLVSQEMTCVLVIWQIARYTRTHTHTSANLRMCTITFLGMWTRDCKPTICFNDLSSYLVLCTGTDRNNWKTACSPSFVFLTIENTPKWGLFDVYPRHVLFLLQYSSIMVPKLLSTNGAEISWAWTQRYMWTLFCAKNRDMKERLTLLSNFSSFFADISVNFWNSAPDESRKQLFFIRAHVQFKFPSSHTPLGREGELGVRSGETVRQCICDEVARCSTSS